MPPIFDFILAVIFITLISSSVDVTCLCVVTVNDVNCSVTSDQPSVNITDYIRSPVSETRIVYSGNVTLQLLAPLTNVIVIVPKDESDNNTLQITRLNTNALRIDVRIRLTTNQAQLPLFPASSTIIAPNASLRINIQQMISNMKDFKIFDTPPLPVINITNYIVIFDTNTSNSGILNLPNLVGGLSKVSSISISGNNHSLYVNSANMLTFNGVVELSLKKLRLYDPILDKFENLKTYSVEECEYNRTAQFLISTNTFNLTLIMKNNYPLDLTLPNGNNAFKGLSTFINMILIEPRLDSSVLSAIQNNLRLRNLTLEFGSYQRSDLYKYANSSPIVWYLTINNIANLSIFSPRFFFKLDALQNTVLRGNFTLEKETICAFVGIKLPDPVKYPRVALMSSLENSNNWDTCADTYIRAINQPSMTNVICRPDNSIEDCRRWAAATATCNLSSYEKYQCSSPYTPDLSGSRPFDYANSSLYNFFQSCYWLTRPPTAYTPKPNGDSVNTAAIIGALCALLAAITILTLTIYCIRRYRRKESTKYISSAPDEREQPPPYDFSHMSIATSKSSKSSHRGLEDSFFPYMQPNDEIAPPLYTAPSDSVASHSAYKVTSAPPGRRESNATHVYETLES